MRFDSRNSQCKSPFGAAVCGAEVSFRLLGREDYAAAQLVARFEFARITQSLSPPTAITSPVHCAHRTRRS